MVTAWAGVWFRLPEPPLPLRGRRLGAVARDLLRLGEQLREPIDLSILGSDTNTQGLETQGVDESGDRMRFVGHAPRFVDTGAFYAPRPGEPLPMSASSIVRANATEKEKALRFHRLALHH